MSEEALQFTIKSDTAKLQADLKSIVDGLTAVKSSSSEVGATTSASMTKASESTTKFGMEVNKANKETIGLRASVDALAPALRMIGPAAVEGAEGIASLERAFTGLIAVAPELLVITAALAGIMAAFNSIKEGVEGAAKMDEALGQITATLHQTGKAADDTKAKVKEFADSLGLETGASAEDSTKAIQKLTAAHIPLGTAMAIVRDANLEAIASGRSATEIEDALMHAVQGRTRGLVALGIITKEEAKHGIALSEVNKRILDSTKETAEIYKNSLPGALALAGENFKQLTVEIGKNLEPTLVNMVKGINDGITVFREFADTVGPYVSEAFNLIKQAISGLQKFFAPLMTDVTELGMSIKATLASIVVAWQDFYNKNKAVIDLVIKAIKAISDFVVGVFLTETRAGLKLIVDIFKTTFDLIKTAVDLFTGLFSKNWKSFQGDIKVLTDDGMQMVNDVFGGHLADMVAACQTAIDQIKDKFSQLKTAMSDAIKGDFGGAVSALGGVIAFDPNKIKSDYAAHLAAVRAIFTQHHQEANAIRNREAARIGGGGGHSDGGVKPKSDDPVITDTELGGGGPKKAKKEKSGGADSSVTITYYGQLTDAVDKYKAAQTALEMRLKTSNTEVDKDRIAVASATTVVAEHAAKAKLAADTLALLEGKHILLTNAVTKNKAEVNDLTYLQAKQLDTVNRLGKEHDALTKVIEKSKGGTVEQQRAVANLEFAYKEALKTHDKTKATVAELTAIFDKNKLALQANADAVAHLTDAHAAFMRSLDAEKIRLAENLTNEIATYEMSTAAQIDYYQNKLSLLNENNVDDEAAITAYNSKIGALQLKYIQESQAADKQAIDKANALRKKTLEEATKDVNDFLDNFLVKHQSFGSALKSLMDNIQKQYMESISKMLTGGAGFQNFLSKALGLGGVQKEGGKGNNPEMDALLKAHKESATATNKGTTATVDLKNMNSTLHDITGRLHESTGTLNKTNLDLITAVKDLNTSIKQSAQSGGSSGGFSSGGDVISSAFGSAGGLGGLFKGITGSSSGVSPDSITAIANSSSPATAASQGVGVPDMGNSSFGDYGKASGAKAGIATYAAGGMEIIQGLSKGGTFSQTLGGLGTVIGGAVAGPIGAAIGQIAGSIIGGFFGPHWGNAPDRTDNTNYRQTIQNLIGGTSDDSKFSQDPSSMKVTKGASEASYIQSELAKGKETFMKDTGASEADYKKALSFFGTNASAVLQHGKDIGDLSYGNGQHMQYNAAQTLANSILNSASNAGGAANVYGITRSAPNFENAAISKIGEFTNGIYQAIKAPITSTQQGFGGGFLGGVVGGLFGGPPKTGVSPIHITIGTLVGSNGMEELTHKLEQMMVRNRFNNTNNTSGAY